MRNLPHPKVRFSWLVAGLCPLVLLAAEPLYQVPVSVSAQRFRLDYPTISGGVVVLDFALDAEGAPRDLRARHGDGPFRAVVTSSLLRGWRFALPEEAPVDPRVAAVFLFRQPQLLAVKTPTYDLASLFQGPETPPQVRHILEPQHPARVNTDGVAVLAVRVSETGSLTGATPLFGSGEFTAAASQALTQWGFDPARQEGEAVAGGLLVIVYFPQPSL